MAHIHDIERVLQGSSLTVNGICTSQYSPQAATSNSLVISSGVYLYVCKQHTLLIFHFGNFSF